MERISGDPTMTCAGSIHHALLRIRRRIMVGARAIEIAKFDFTPYMYARREGITTLDQLLESPPETFVRIAGSRPVFQQIVANIAQIDPDWTPPVVAFADELPLEETYST